MTNVNFDKIAPVYDRLARLVFGQAIIHSQVRFLDHIKPGSTILIVGGGTGWILNAIDERVSNCSVYYLESSQEMIRRSKKRSLANNKVIFLEKHSQDPGNVYDVVITNFYLDLYDDQELNQIINGLSSALIPGGYWLVTDFTINGSGLDRFWKLWLVRIMYRFFWITANLKTHKLPQYKTALNDSSLFTDQEDYFFGKFIYSGIYRKISP